MTTESKAYLETIWKRVLDAREPDDVLHHQDGTITARLIGGTVIDEKPCRFFAITNPKRRQSMAGVAISRLGQEYRRVEALLKEFVRETRNIHIQTVEGGRIVDYAQFPFTRDVLLYTDRLLVPKSEIQNYFALKNWKPLIVEEVITH